jgi:hypothetical protein
MEIEDIKQRFIKSLERFLQDDKYLLEKAVSERAMTHKLAEHLQVNFPGHNVDCEYNRNRNKPKELQFRFNKALLSEVEKLIARAHQYAAELKKPESEYGSLEDPLPPFSTYPDIIVHTRGNNHPDNILIIEVKKHNAGTDDDLNFDFAKLEAFTSDDGLNPYGYLLGIHLILFCRSDAERAPEVRYFMCGNLVS